VKTDLIAAKVAGQELGNPSMIEEINRESKAEFERTGVVQSNYNGKGSLGCDKCTDLRVTTH
jgi:hypothetical protein